MSEKPKKSQIELEQEIKSLRSDLQGMKNRTTKVENRLDNIEPHQVEKYLNSIHQEAKELHSKLGLMILKVIVSTELHHLSKTIYSDVSEELHMAIIAAFDWSDKWWKSMDDSALYKWKDELLKEHKKQRMKEAGQNQHGASSLMGAIENG